ncbi:MAG: YfhO family protein [Candidatus Paceibacterota bacterium]|jgi:hypothetical protein
MRIKEFMGICSVFISVLTLFFYKSIFYGLSMVPASVLYKSDYLYGPLSKQAENFRGNDLISDLVYQMYPWHAYIFQSLKNGYIPLWNPYTLGGMPFLANDQSSIFEITKLFSYLTNISANDFYAFSGFASLLMAGIFTYAFLRNLGVGKCGSMVGGFSFMFSGPIVAWMGYPLTSVAIWLPFLLLFIDKILQHDRNKMYIGLFSLAIGFQFFAGNPEISLFLLSVSAVYAIFRLSEYRPWKTGKKMIMKKSVSLTLGIILGFCIASVQVIPTLELLKQSTSFITGRDGLAGNDIGRIITKEWNGWRNLSDVKDSLGNIALVIYPDYFGNPANGQYWGAKNYNENAFHPGIIPLIFALLAILSSLHRLGANRKNIFFWTAIAVFCMGVFLNFPVFRIVSYLPMFELTIIGRLRFVFVFALAVLAAYGTDHFLKADKKELKRRIISFNILYALTSAAIFLFVVVGKRYFSNFSLTSKDLIPEATLIVSLFIFLNSAFLLISHKEHPWRHRLGKAILIALAVAELFYYGYGYHPVIPKDLIYPENPAVQFMQNNIGNYRFTNYGENDHFDSLLRPNASVLWNLQDIRGYEIVQIYRYEVFKNVFEVYLKDRYAYKYFHHRFFDILGVKYFIQGKNDLETNKVLESTDGIELAYSDSYVNIYENTEVIPRAFVVFNISKFPGFKEVINNFLWNEDYRLDSTALIETERNEETPTFENDPALESKEAGIISYKPNEIRLTTDVQRDGYLVLTDVYYPGWKAYIDGHETKIYPTDSLFRGIFVPEGKHMITFKYRPDSFYKSMYIAIFGSAISLLLILTHLLKRKKIGTGD